MAYGYDVTLGDGDTIDIGPGLAIDAQGRAAAAERDIDQHSRVDRKAGAAEPLLREIRFRATAVSGRANLQRATPAINPLAASDLFVITISLAEALCGEEDVFGNLCEEACVTSTDRPFAVEGVTVRAVPLALQTPLPNSKAFPLTGLHLRSRVASTYFEDGAAA